MFIDIIIRAVRLPIAIFASLAVPLNMFFAMIIEIPVIIICIIVLSIFTSKEEIKSSWVSGFPNSTNGMIIIIKNIYMWALHPDSEFYSNVNQRTDAHKNAFLVFNTLSVTIIMISIFNEMRLGWFFDFLFKGASLGVAWLIIQEGWKK